MSINVNFGSFKSKMVGIRPRNQSKQQHSSKQLNMAAIERELEEQDERLKMLEQAEDAGMLRQGYPDEPEIRIDTIPEAVTLLPYDVSLNAGTDMSTHSALVEHGGYRSRDTSTTSNLMGLSA